MFPLFFAARAFAAVSSTTLPSFTHYPRFVPWTASRFYFISPSFPGRSGPVKMLTASRFFFFYETISNQCICIYNATTAFTRVRPVGLYSPFVGFPRGYRYFRIRPHRQPRRQTRRRVHVYSLNRPDYRIDPTLTGRRQNFTLSIRSELPPFVRCYRWIFGFRRKLFIFVKYSTPL